MGGSIGIPIPDNLVGNSGDGSVEVRLFQLTLPDDDDAPPFRLQLTPDFLVSHLVPRDLSHPEFRVGLGDSIVLTVFMTMPKAAVYKDDGAVFGEDDVRGARKASIINFVAESQAPECMAEFQLRFCRGGANGDHITMALDGRENIWHYNK